MINVIMIEDIIKIGIGQIADKGESNLVVEFNMDRITEVDQDMDKAKGMILGEEILGAM